MPKHKRKVKPPKERGNAAGVIINSTSLRILYQERGLTQQVLADMVGVTITTIQMWLWGERNPSKKNFEKLCAALQVSPNMLEISTSELVERGRHARVSRFYNREMLGKNLPPEYKEVQRVEADLQDAAVRESAEEEVRAGKLTVFGAGQSSGDSESDTAEGDGDAES